MSAAAFYRELVAARAADARFLGLGGEPGALLAHAANPICGDELTLEIVVTTTIRVRYEGHACLVCLASAELLATAVHDRAEADAFAIARRFLDALADGSTEDLSADLVAMLAVRALPVRVACAKLPWDALSAVLVARAVSDEPAR